MEQQHRDQGKTPETVEPPQAGGVANRLLGVLDHGHDPQCTRDPVRADISQLWGAGSFAAVSTRKRGKKSSRSTGGETRRALRPRERVFGHLPVLDGLRGLAVAVVVLYHFAPGILPGGFVGVDVFFVLSGFLLTSLVLVEHHNTRTVSVSGFWGRRIRRLLPAALATVVVSVAIAFVLEPDYTRNALRGQAIAAIAYVSNWWSIGHDQSYASSFGPQSPVSHFWSLAVEEQFYLLFPFLVLGVVVAVGRLGRRRLGRERLNRLSVGLLIVSALGALASAIAMVLLHTAGTDPSRVYLGTDTRVQTILIGVCLACVWYLRPPSVEGAVEPSTARKRSIVAALLLLALVAGTRVITFTSDWLYQGGLTLVAIGVAALIWNLTRHAAGPAHLVLTTGLMRRLGEVSYGLYLWHWPVMVFLNPQRTGIDGPALFLLRTVVTAAATAISYTLIEQPFRRGRFSGRSTAPAGTDVIPRPSTQRVLALWGASSFMAIILVGLLTIGPTIGGTTPTATPPPTATTGTTLVPGQLAASAPYTVLWIGDSVMWSLGGGGPIVFPQPKSFTSPFDPTKLVIWNRAVYPCEILRYPSRFNGLLRAHNTNCDSNDWVEAAEQLDPQIIVFSSIVSDTYDRYVNGRLVEFASPEFDQMYLDALERTLLPLTAHQPQVVLLEQPLPFTVFEPNGRPAENWRVLHIGQLYRRFAATHPHTSVVDLKPIVCPDDPCNNELPGGGSVRSDGIHFTEAGTLALAPQVADAIIAAARSTGTPVPLADPTTTSTAVGTIDR